MKHQFCRFELSLALYQEQEIPTTILPYEDRFERSLISEVARCSQELNWNDMWTYDTMYIRLKQGWKFFVFRPKNQIKGWVWLPPDKPEIKNLYVSKWFRNQGWGSYLILAGLNEYLNSDIETVLYRADTWNVASKKCIENVLYRTGIKCTLSFTEEDY